MRVNRGKLKNQIIINPLLAYSAGKKENKDMKKSYNIKEAKSKRRL